MAGKMGGKGDGLGWGLGRWVTRHGISDFSHNGNCSASGWDAGGWDVAEFNGSFRMRMQVDGIRLIFLTGQGSVRRDRGWSYGTSVLYNHSVSGVYWLVLP